MDNEIEEFLRGIADFEANRPTNQPVISRVLYNKMTGAIVKKITGAYENTDDKLDLLDVDQTYIHNENLMDNFCVRSGAICLKERQTLDYSKKVLMSSDTGKFTTAKDNMLFVAADGDRYDHRKN
jgi:hypothetical protein